MYHYLEAILDSATGKTFIGAYARVLNAETGSSAPIYADNNGTPIATVSGLANAAKTDGDGNLSFFIVPGTYHLDLYDTDGETFIRRFSDIPMTSTQGREGDPGPEGPPGPSNNTRVSLAALKGAATTDKTSLYDGSLWTWTLGNFTGLADDTTIVKSDTAPLTEGAWVRQKADATNFDGRSVAAKLEENASVTDARFAGGAVGGGTADDSAAFQAALAAARHVFVPPGRYLLSQPVKIADGRRIYGVGKSAWEPYTGGDFPDVSKSEILVDGTMAFDASETNSAAIAGLAIKAVGGTQSAYAAAPGYQAGAIGIDITASSQFELDDVSFHGLEVAVQANQGDNADAGPTASGVETDFAAIVGTPTQMPRIRDIMATDCLRVFKFGTSASTGYTVRDARIAGVVIALHCGQIGEFHWCDGVRTENARYYQCAEYSLTYRACVYVDLIGATIFETKEGGIKFDSCANVTIAGAEIARSGTYYAATPYPQKIGLEIVNCNGVAFQGKVEKPSGKAIVITNSAGVTISAQVDTPFFSTGNPSNTNAAIEVTNTRALAYNLSVTGEGHRVSLLLDGISQRTAAGTIATDAGTGVVRAVKGQQSGGFISRLSQDLEIAAGGVAPIDTLRILVPAGKLLKTRSVEMTSPTVQLRANGLTWNAEVVAETGGGTLAFDDRTLFDNSAGATVWASVPISLFNPSGALVTVPAGHETRISTVITNA